jgi:hypothetical protein
MSLSIKNLTANSNSVAFIFDIVTTVMVDGSIK